MSPVARRRALRAAAAVAAFSTAGCGPRKAPAVAPEVSEPAAAEPEAVEAPEATGDVTEAEAQACAVEVDTALEGQDASLTQDSAACCSTLDAFYSANMDRFDEWPTRGACCDLLNWQGGIACTPWGPPPPPAFAARSLA